MLFKWQLSILLLISIAVANETTSSLEFDVNFVQITPALGPIPASTSSPLRFRNHADDEWVSVTYQTWGELGIDQKCKFHDALKKERFLQASTMQCNQFIDWIEKNHFPENPIPFMPIDLSELKIEGYFNLIDALNNGVVRFDGTEIIATNCGKEPDPQNPFPNWPSDDPWNRGRDDDNLAIGRHVNASVNQPKNPVVAQVDSYLTQYGDLVGSCDSAACYSENGGQTLVDELGILGRSLREQREMIAKDPSRKQELAKIDAALRKIEGMGETVAQGMAGNMDPARDLARDLKPDLISAEANSSNNDTQAVITLEQQQQDIQARIDRGETVSAEDRAILAKKPTTTISTINGQSGNAVSSTTMSRREYLGLDDAVLSGSTSDNFSSPTVDFGNTQRGSVERLQEISARIQLEAERRGQPMTPEQANELALKYYDQDNAIINFDRVLGKVPEVNQEPTMAEREVLSEALDRNRELSRTAYLEAASMNKEQFTDKERAKIRDSYAVQKAKAEQKSQALKDKISENKSLANAFGKGAKNYNPQGSNVANNKTPGTSKGSFTPSSSGGSSRASSGRSGRGISRGGGGGSASAVGSTGSSRGGGGRSSGGGSSSGGGGGTGSGGYSSSTNSENIESGSDSMVEGSGKNKSSGRAPASIDDVEREGLSSKEEAIADAMKTLDEKGIKVRSPEEIKRYGTMLEVLTNYSLDKIGKDKLQENFNTYIPSDSIGGVVTLKEDLFNADNETVMSTVVVNLYIKDKHTRFLVEDRNDRSNLEELHYDFSSEGNFKPTKSGPVMQRLVENGKLEALSGLEKLAQEKKPLTTNVRLINAETGRPYYEE